MVIDQVAVGRGSRDRDLAREQHVLEYGVVGVRQPELDDLAILATQLCHVPAAAINLAMADVQATVAAVGMEVGVCALEDAMCTPVLHDPTPVFVPDAAQDPRWERNPYVTGELAAFRFYAVHQLVNPRGVTVGTMCLFDVEPHQPDEYVVVQLASLAARVVDVLELQLRTRQLEVSVLELDRSRAELSRSNEMLRLFATQIAHDLRGPISAVNASLELLDDGEEGLDAQERQWLIQRSAGSVARMNELIRDMLDFASVGGGQVDDTVDLASLVTELRDDLAGELDGVDLVSRDLPSIRGDRTQWRVVLQNLISNAAKFNDAQDPQITVAGYLEADEWVIEVSDNGPGVPEADRELVFGLMSQGDPTGDGVGLGLATCQRIIAAHGGIVAMRGIQPRGAQVHIRLPFQRRSVAV